MIVILCTTRSIEEAPVLSKGFLAKKLIACASVIQPVESWYLWEGDVETAQEIQLVLKTKREHYRAVEAWITAKHSYEVPEILALPVETGLKSYLDWVFSSV